MTGRNRLAVALGVLVALVAAVTPATADDGRDEKASKRIAIAMPGRFVAVAPDGASGDLRGTWQAVGAFVDSGTYSEHFVLSNNNTHIVARKTLTSALDGSTILLEVRTTVVWLSPTAATFDGGTWRFIGGTGRYDGLEGGGRPATAFGFADLAAGTVLVVHAGRADLDD